MKRTLILSAIVLFVVIAFGLVANEAAASWLTTGGNGPQNLPAEPLLLLELGALLVIFGVFIGLPVSEFVRARPTRK